MLPARRCWRSGPGSPGSCTTSSPTASASWSSRRARAEQFIDADSRAREPLTAIRLTGQQALVEMRHLLGILRTDNDARLTLAPQPGLDNIESLVDAARSSGLNVTVATTG